MRNTLAKITPPLVFGVIVIAGWELLTILTDADPRIYPAPSEVVAALFKNPASMWRNAMITALEMVLGFGVGAVVGIALGTLLAYSRIARSAIYPWLIVSQTIPIPAVAAVLVIWFGFSM